MDVAHEGAAAPLGGEVVALVNHQPAVRVPAAQRVVRRTAARLAPLRARPVQVVGGTLHQLEEIRPVVLAEHPLVIAAGDDVPVVPDDIVREERLPVLIPVQAPGIRRAATDHVELLRHRMVAPDGAVQRYPIIRRRARPAHRGLRGDAVAAVKPAVRPPREAVHEVVPRVDVPPRQGDHRRAVRHIVAVGIRDEEQVRQREHPHAAEARQHARHVAARVEENLPLHVAPRAIAVREDEDAVGRGVGDAVVLLGGGIGEVLDHPEPPTVIELHRDGLHDLRLGGEELRAEARRQSNLLQRLRRGRGQVPGLLRIRDAGRELGGEGKAKSKRQKAKGANSPGEETKLHAAVVGEGRTGGK